jgi:hypothetical protein
LPFSLVASIDERPGFSHDERDEMHVFRRHAATLVAQAVLKSQVFHSTDVGFLAAAATL